MPLVLSVEIPMHIIMPLVTLTILGIAHTVQVKINFTC
jgi:hypothetical protein